MAIIDSYRKSAFLQNESGSHLDQWRTSAYWKSVQSQSGANKPPKGWSHYVLEPPERALDYLDWLNHRHSRKPYLLRRLLHPTWLLARILEAVASQQLARIQGFEQAQSFPAQAYAAKAKVWEYEIQRCLKASGWLMPLIRVVRHSSDWLREREKLIQASIEAKQREAGSVPEPIEVRARPWDQLGVGTWKANEIFRGLLELQLKADQELFIVLEDFSRCPVLADIPLRYFLPKDGNPQLSRHHYIFENAPKCIAYLVWLNHRHPNWPYPLRRALLPIRTLARFVEAIANYQISQILNSEIPPRPPAGYPAQAANWEREIKSCLEQKPWAIPMMRVFRLSSEWLRERQSCIEASGASPRESEPIEVKARSWKQPNARKAPYGQVLRELLALQLQADKTLAHAAAKIEE